MKKRLIKAYDALAYDYENHVDQNNIFNTEYERPAMIKYIPENLKNMQVLDAGCAAGWYTEQLIERHADVWAIDISSKMVAATKRRVGDQAKVIQHDLAERLPFADESMDFIVSSLVLHYVSDWQKLFAEFQRILKKGGSLLFSVHHPMMDIKLSEHAEYFKREFIVDQWKRDGVWIDVPFFRRPLQNIINDTVRFFTLERIVEPQPTRTFKEKKPEKYARLSKQPHFLIVKAEK